MSSISNKFIENIDEISLCFVFVPCLISVFGYWPVYVLLLIVEVLLLIKCKLLRVCFYENRLMFFVYLFFNIFGLLGVYVKYNFHEYFIGYYALLIVFCMPIFMIAHKKSERIIKERYQ